MIAYLSIEEVRVTLELIRQPLVWGVQELSLVSNSLEEGFVDLILDVIAMVLGFFLLVVLEESLDFFFKLVLLLIQVLHHSIILLLLFVVDGFKV